MTYRVNANIAPLIWVEVTSMSKPNRIVYSVKIISKFKTRSVANNVQVIVPVPSDVDTPLFKVFLEYKIDRSWISQVPTRKRCICMDDKAIPWWKRRNFDCTIWVAFTKERGIRRN